jgi:hypothetical protein
MNKSLKISEQNALKKKERISIFNEGFIDSKISYTADNTKSII